MDGNVRRTGAALLVASLAALGLTTPPAGAVNANHGNQVVSADPANFTPHVMNGSVNAITQIGNKIIAAGTFTSVSPAGTFGNTADDVVRNRIFAFDATTGVIDPTFNPNLGGAANSLDTDGTFVYVSGSFGSVGGNSAIKRVVKLTAAGAVVDTFNAVPNSGVNEVVVRGSRLYIGGGFTTVRSSGVTTTRNRLAALDPTTGAVLSSVNVSFAGVYDPNQTNGGGTTNVKRFDVSPDGTRLAAIGNFATAGGLPRVQLAVLDVSGANATVASWATNRYDRAHNNCAQVFDTFTRDIDFSPDGSYFAVSATGAFAGGAGSGTLCDTVTRWETNSTGNDPSWADYTGGDTTYGVAVTGSAVYVGGHQRYFNNPFQGDQAGPGAVTRTGIAALDPVNGLPLSWNPGRNRGVGAQAMYATSQGLWVGSDTTQIGGETHGRVAFMPLAGGTTVPAVPAATLPNDLFVAQQTAGGVLQRRAVNSSGAPTGSPSTANSAMDWSTVRGAFLLNGTVYYGLSNGTFDKRTFDKVSGGTGGQVAVNLHPDPDNGTQIPFAISTMTGMFYDTTLHRIYYTVSGDSRLFYRYFTPESEIVGAQTFQADAGGVNFSTAAGMTLASGRILYGSSSDGALRSAPFSGGRVTGGATVVSNDGTWRYRAIFVPNT
jgi:hypothetical protein